MAHLTPPSPNREFLEELRKRWEEQASSRNGSVRVERAYSSPEDPWGKIYAIIVGQFDKISQYARLNMNLAEKTKAVVLTQIDAARRLLDAECESNPTNALKKSLNSETLKRMFPDIDPSARLESLRQIVDQIRQESLR
ncbi:MAG: hypothetical protein K1X28_07855 [Parachlamydiales bacterium]|nr:hypothetical protein [Parachlamydiales bacterium]